MSFELLVCSWSMETYQLAFQKMSPEVNMQDYTVNQQWSVDNTNVYITTWTGQYAALNASLTLSRKPDFYIVNIVLPTMLLSGLTLLVFLMPAEAKEKTVLVATMLLSLAVFATVVANEVPKTSSSTPLLCKNISRSYVIMHNKFGAEILRCFINYDFYNYYLLNADWINMSCDKLILMHEDDDFSTYYK